MKLISNISSKIIKISLFTFIIISIFGGILLYLNNPKIKFMRVVNSEYKSFIFILDGIKDKELTTLSKNNTINSSGNISFDVVLGNNMFSELLNPFVDFINDLDINYDYGFDPTKKNTYLKIDNNILDDDFLDVELYQVGDKKYIYLNDIYDKYIESDSIDFIESRDDNLEDIIYLTDTFKKSLMFALKTSDFKIEKKQIDINKEMIEANKITLKLTDVRIKQILTRIVNDFKKDDKCITILKKLTGNKDVVSSLTDMLTSLNSSDKVLEEDLMIDTYVKDNVVVRLDIISGNIKTIEYLNYTNFYPVKEIMFFESEKVVLRAIFEEKASDNISYEISFGDEQFVFSGAVSRIVSKNQNDKTWNTEFFLSLLLTSDNEIIGSVKISGKTTTKIGEEVKLIDFDNTIKQSDIKEEEQKEISTKLLEKIMDVLSLPTIDDMSDQPNTFY